MVSCGMSVIKYVLFIFNFIFAVSGIGLIVAGSVVLSNIGSFSHFLEARIIAPPIVLIVAGAIVFIIAFLGCYGAIKEHYNMLIAFSLLLLIIFVIELAVGIAAAVFKTDFDVTMKKTLHTSMMNYTKVKVDRLTWDNVQMQLECCGVESPEDWLSNPDFSNLQMPHSCCKDLQDLNCQLHPSKIHATGCFQALKEIVQKSATVLIGVGIGIAFIEIAGIILACCLASAIRTGGDK